MYIGIDVSDHNGILDWDAIKAQGIEFAIIRTGYGSNVEYQHDRQAIRNLQECERLKIPYGIYNYSYALNNAEAISEAEHALEMIRGFNPRLGIFIDMEDSDGYKTRHNLIPEQNGSVLTDFCIIFMDKIRIAGYIAGVYANHYYFTNILQLERLADYTKWLAIWGVSEHPEGDWTIWQFTSEGKINGSSIRTDLNYYLKEFPEISTKPVVENPTEEKKPIQLPVSTYKVGDRVNYTSIYYESGALVAFNPMYTDGIIINYFEGSRNPYLVDHDGVGIGFLNDSSITGLFSTQPSNGVNPQTYTIVAGDTLSEIATRFGTTYQNLAQINGIKDPNFITVGQIIKITDQQIEVKPDMGNSEFKVGSNVRVKKGATDVNGTFLANYVYTSVYTIQQRNENKYLIGNSKGSTAWMYADSLYLA